MHYASEIVHDDDADGPRAAFSSAFTKVHISIDALLYR